MVLSFFFVGIHDSLFLSAQLTRNELLSGKKKKPVFRKVGEDFCLCLTNDPTDHFTILELQISSIGKIPDRPFYHFIGQNS